MSGIWAAYNRALAKNPLLVKAMTSFTGFTLGDILAQKFINTEDKFDFARTLRLASFGGLVHGPTGHWFYGMLDSKLPGTKPATVAAKVAIDQTIWNPIFGVMFFTYLGLAEGKTVDDISNKIRSDLPTAVMGSWSVWVPAHAVNFKFVPPSQRLLYINTIQVGYNVFLSFLGNRKAGGGADDDDKSLHPQQITREDIDRSAHQYLREVGDKEEEEEEYLHTEALALKAGALELKDNLKEDAQEVAEKVHDKVQNVKGAGRELGGVAGDLRSDVKADLKDAKEDARQVLRDKGLLDGTNIDPRSPEEKARDARKQEFEKAKKKLGWNP